jgi:antitoxin component of MazEF toxin-antitoxin module
MPVREILNVRQIGNTLVVTIPKSLLQAVPLKAGRRVLLSTFGSKRIPTSHEAKR